MQQPTPCFRFGVIILGIMLLRLAPADGRAASLASLEGQFFDGAFLTQVIQHHHHGVQLAQTGAQYAQREDLRHFAAEITVTLMKEIHDCETLRTGSGGAPSKPADSSETTGSGPGTVAPIPPPAVPRMVETSPGADTPEHQRNRETLARLAAAGTRFDGMFLQEMTAYYTAGRELAELAREKGSARAVKDLAEALARAQSHELTELKRLQGVGAR